jgi:hypothetical protein
LAEVSWTTYFLTVQGVIADAKQEPKSRHQRTEVHGLGLHFYISGPEAEKEREDDPHQTESIDASSQRLGNTPWAPIQVSVDRISGFVRSKAVRIDAAGRPIPEQ